MHEYMNLCIKENVNNHGCTTIELFLMPMHSLILQDKETSQGEIENGAGKAC
jgi:hypothetical protein